MICLWSTWCFSKSQMVLAYSGCLEKRWFNRCSSTSTYLFSTNISILCKYKYLYSWPLLIGWREGHPACKKYWAVGCWHGYVSGSRCRFHIAQLMPLLLATSCSSKSKLLLPFWCRLTRVVPDIIQEGCMCMFVHVCACMHACML